MKPPTLGDFGVARATTRQREASQNEVHGTVGATRGGCGRWHPEPEYHEPDRGSDGPVGRPRGDRRYGPALFRRCAPPTLRPPEAGRVPPSDPSPRTRWRDSPG